jgi:hypothetical protein
LSGAQEITNALLSAADGATDTAQGTIKDTGDGTRLETLAEFTSERVHDAFDCIAQRSGKEITNGIDQSTDCIKKTPDKTADAVE